MAVLYKEKTQMLGHIQMNAHFPSFDMTGEVKDVGNYFTCLGYTFSMGTLIWKVSHILNSPGKRIRLN